MLYVKYKNKKMETEMKYLKSNYFPIGKFPMNFKGKW